MSRMAGIKEDTDPHPFSVYASRHPEVVLMTSCDISQLFVSLLFQGVSMFFAVLKLGVLKNLKWQILMRSLRKY